MRFGREHRRAGGTSSPRWAILQHQFDLVQRATGLVYLRRWWIIKTPWFGIILHRMDAPDARPELHDHPFGFLSIVLRGGYIERRLRPRESTIDETHRVRFVNRVRPFDAHSIRRLLSVPTWTLLLVGPYRRTWGFLLSAHPIVSSELLDKIAEGLDLPKGLRLGHDLDSITEYRWIRHDHFDSGHDAVSAEHAGEAETHRDVRSCRGCGCTDDDCSGCIERTGFACVWIADDLCSSCAANMRPGTVIYGDGPLAR